MNTTVTATTTVASVTPIDFSSIHTYGELKKALPSTGTQKVPGIRQLRSKSEVILHKEGMSGVIEIYANGFFTFEESERLTVFGVDRCDNPKLYCALGEPVPASVDFDPYPWEMILEEAGAARLDHNGESREDYQSEISIDAPESENNIALSVKPEHERWEQEEKEKKAREEHVTKLKNLLSTLTEKQYQIVVMDRVEGMTQTEIAEKLGISRRTVREHLAAIEKKLKIA